MYLCVPDLDFPARGVAALLGCLASCPLGCLLTYNISLARLIEY